MQHRFTLGILIYLLFSKNAFALNCILPNFQADYRITYLGIPVGKATTQFETNQSHYQYKTRSISTLIFTHQILTENSEGKFSQGHLIPKLYQYRYLNRSKFRNVDIHFDWQNKHVINTTDNQSWKMNVPMFTQDKLAYQIELTHDLCLGKKLITYHIADGGKLKTYDFEIVSNEKINTRLGKLDTIKVIRKPLPNKRDTTLWLAPSMHYLVVRATQTDSTAGLAVAEVVNVNWRKTIPRKHA